MESARPTVLCDHVVCGARLIRKALGRQDHSKPMIQLIGPGSAGKTTAGIVLAERLGVTFVDLDAEFTANSGDISIYLDTHSYDAYANRNVSLYSALVSAPRPPEVVALSSGFMTYRRDVHLGYSRWRQDIASSPSTVVLLPSLDLETCVAEIVRRQLLRPFARSAEREEHVIRTRFPIYANIPARRVETMRPVNAVVAELLAPLAAQQTAAPLSKRASRGVRGYPVGTIAFVWPG
jgi:shikimate kinase